ncbi:hypothetical protein [Nitrospira sp. Nam80]
MARVGFVLGRPSSGLLKGRTLACTFPIDTLPNSFWSHILDETHGFGYNLEFVTIHGLPFRADGHAVNIAPSSFPLLGIEPTIQYRFEEHWVGDAGVLFTVAGQNNIDAKGGAMMR